MKVNILTKKDLNLFFKEIKSQQKALEDEVSKLRIRIFELEKTNNTKKMKLGKNK